MQLIFRQQSVSVERTTCRCFRNVHRSTRRGFVDFLQQLIGRYPFRCWDCGRRFYRFRRR
jgi:hypothetical protein